MDRVLNADWLREEFLELCKSDSQVVWRASAVDSYLR